jgi:hypothetical protein
MRTLFLFPNFLPKFYGPYWPPTSQTSFFYSLLFIPPILRIYLSPRIDRYEIEFRGPACQSGPTITETITVMWDTEFYTHITGATVVESVFLWTSNNKPKQVNDVRRNCLLYKKAFTGTQRREPNNNKHQHGWLFIHAHSKLVWLPGCRLHTVTWLIW